MSKQINALIAFTFTFILMWVFVMQRAMDFLIKILQKKKTQIDYSLLQWLEFSRKLWNHSNGEWNLRYLLKPRHFVCQNSWNFMSVTETPYNPIDLWMVHTILADLCEQKTAQIIFVKSNEKKKLQFFIYH